MEEKINELQGKINEISTKLNGTITALEEVTKKLITHLHEYNSEMKEIKDYCEASTKLLKILREEVFKG